MITRSWFVHFADWDIEIVTNFLGLQNVLGVLRRLIWAHSEARQRKTRRSGFCKTVFTRFGVDLTQSR